MYDMMYLALQTDSTRLITFFKNGINAVPQITGVSNDYHNLSHHGRDPDKIAELGIIELEQFSALANFVRRLHETAEGESTLLERTMVLFGSNLGNASSHNTLNMPIVLAGGGFRHGQHLAFDRDNNYPLPNLYVSMLQRLGVETDSFVTSTGSMRGLEMTSGELQFVIPAQAGIQFFALIRRAGLGSRLRGMARDFRFSVPRWHVQVIAYPDQSNSGVLYASPFSSTVCRPSGCCRFEFACSRRRGRGKACRDC
jgi:hypothetical protein